ncbi:MAG: FkbM family methyltransferase, partial [Limisphaerales bacterium]
MKQFIKLSLGNCLRRTAQWCPAAKPFLRSLGIRTSEPTFKNSIASIQFRRRPPLDLTNAHENYLSFQLFWRGGDFYEPATRTILELLARSSRTFFDIGANIGFFTLSLGTLHPHLSIFAFEPNPKNFQILSDNIAINNLTAVTSESLAISNDVGTATLFLNTSDMSASLLNDFQTEQQIDSIAVQTSSLDGYLQNKPASAPLLIKVDIEGHEAAFFQGATRSITTHHPDIYRMIRYAHDRGIWTYLSSNLHAFKPEKGQAEEL